VGGQSVAPGEARAVRIPLAARSRTDAAAGGRSVPAWVIVGSKPGPRITVVAALRAGEATAARAANRLAASLDPAGLAGSVVVVPVLRPGGRPAPLGSKPLRMPFPGAADGKRLARDAFALFSDLVVGAQALIVLAGPRRGRRGVVVARGQLEDPRVHRLATRSGAAALLPAALPAGSLLAAAAAAKVVAVELSAAGAAYDADAAEPLVRAARALLTGMGVLPPPEGRGAPEGRRAPARVPARALRIRAPADGFLEAPVAPGSAVRARGLLGRFEPPLPGPATALVAPRSGLVIEAAAAGPVRAGATLFALVRSPAFPGRARHRTEGEGAEPRADIDGKTRVGWVEHVALPRLEIGRLKAKIDTGARTSALHVTRMRTIDTAGGPHGRPILEITVPGGRRGERPHVVRATVRGFAMVRDTSGRTERRPVIETALKLGPFERRITVTLTDRGDMLFPMLVGRTALGPGVVVDPSRRYLLGKN